MKVRLFLGAMLLTVLASASLAQQAFPTVFPSPILLLDRDKLLAQSDLGQSMLAVEQEKREALILENSEIDSKFEIEERELVVRRAELPANEFRVLSEEFDTRVQEVRATQQTKGVELQQDAENSRLRFFVITAPFMSELLQKYQASAILDHRTVLLFSVDMDITDEAIELLDTAFKENPDLGQEEEQ